MTVILNESVGLLVDVSIKAVLLAAVAGAALLALRVRNSNVQHGMWTAVLVGMLTLPLSVAVVPSVPLPAWLYPQLRLQDNEKPSLRRPDALAAAPLSESELIRGEIPKTQTAANGPTLEPSLAASDALVAPEPTQSLTFLLPDSEGGGRWITGIFMAYVLGAVLFLSRLLVGLVKSRRLIRTARPVSLTPAYARLVGATPVCESAAVCVPITVGWRPPCILLSSDWSTWSESMLGAVLVHEHAHVRRRDQWTTLLAEVNRAVYWFHPLAWFLRRRLTALAEQACDDAVIESLGDRTGYAGHLLEVAGRLAGRRGRLHPAGLAMARTPRVERRIDAILDVGRPLAHRMSPVGSLMLVATAAALVFLTAGLSAEQPSAEADYAGRSLLLTVLDNHEGPIAGANVRVMIRQDYMGDWARVRYHCDDAGRVKVDVPEATPNYISMFIEKSGYAPFFAEWENGEVPDPIPDSFTARLDPGRLIGGIVENDEGEPIEGVKVHPRFNLKMREERTHPLGAGVDMTTDARGRWTYPSFPADVGQLEIRLTHPDYLADRISEPISKFVISAGGAPSGVSVMKRGMPIRGKVTDENGDAIAGAAVIYRDRTIGSDRPEAETDKKGGYQFRNGKIGQACFTASAEGWAAAIKEVRIEPGTGPVDFQLQRGKPLHVRVVAADGAPLSDVHLSLWWWEEHDIYGDLLGGRGKTDANGDWRWANAPEGRLRFAISKPGFTYIEAHELKPGQENVVTMSSASPEETQVLKVSGRVVDAETKEPIARFRVTPGEARKEGGPIYWYNEYQSDARDGQYRKVFTPDDFASTTKVLRIEADGYLPATSRVITDQEADVTIDFSLQLSGEADFLVLTPAGQPATGATVAICTPRLGPIIEDGVVSESSTCERTKTSAEGRFSIAPQKGVYALMLVHESGATYVTQEQLKTSKTIQLEPWARIEGTLRIRNKAAADEMITLGRDEPPGLDHPKVHYDYRATTDQDGKFAFNRVVPGSGQVFRNVVTETGGRMSRWTPTHTATAHFAAGETTHVELGRDGQPITGKLLVPKEVEKQNDWRLAMINLQERPENLPQPPEVPFPKDIDPKKDRAAAIKWWENWRYSEEGKKFFEEMNRYNEARQAIKLVSYGTHVEPNGSFVFDDIPAGNYELTVRAEASPANGRIGPGDVIATLKHAFTVPEMLGGRSDEPLDLGELMLEAVPREETGRRPPR